MDTKLELTRSQLETILRIINDINLNNTKKDDKNKLTASSSSKNEIKKTKNISNLSKRRSYSAINLNDTTTSNDEIINESLRKSIANLMNETAKQEEIKIPEIESNFRLNEAQRKLKRNRSLVEIKREKWQKEREELQDSESWYEKFDSFKKKPIDRSRSQPNILNTIPNLIQNYDDNLFNHSVSRLFSPVSNFDEESIVLSNYTGQHSPVVGQLNDRNSLNNDLSNQSNNPIKIYDNNQFMINHSTNPITNNELSINQSINQPRKSFHRYAHQFNNINILEKRRKQQEYQRQLEAQLEDKRRQVKLSKYQEMIEDRRLDEKIQNEQAELRKEFEIDHKGKSVNNNGFSLMKRKEDIIRGKSDKKMIIPNYLEKLEIKSKELAKIFKEASTQTDMDKETLNRPEMINRNDESRQQNSSSKFNITTQFNEPLINQWSTDSNFNHHTQPLRTSRTSRLELLKNDRNNSKPKWTKQVSKKDEDNKTAILPKLANQKTSQLSVRKRWNS